MGKKYCALPRKSLWIHCYTTSLQRVSKEEYLGDVIKSFYHCSYFCLLCIFAWICVIFACNILWFFFLPLSKLFATGFTFIKMGALRSLLSTWSFHIFFNMLNYFIVAVIAFIPSMPFYSLLHNKCDDYLEHLRWWWFSRGVKGKGGG